MSNLTTGADLKADILFRAGEPTNGTSDFDAQALEYLNRAYQTVWMGGGEFTPEIDEDWWWLKKDPPGTLILQPVISVGSVSVTNGSTTITLTNAPATSVAGYHFKVDDFSDIHRISAHTAASITATLGSAYTGSTATNKLYRLFKLEYALATDVLRLIAPMRVSAEDGSEIDGVDLKSLERDFPISRIMSGTPDKFAMVTESKVRFNRGGLTTDPGQILVEYDYLQKPAMLPGSTEEPLVPFQYRQILADIGLFYMLLAKDDDRAQAIGFQAKGGLTAMARENRRRNIAFSRNYGKIIPRPQQAVSTIGPRVLRTTTGVIIG